MMPTVRFAIISFYSTKVHLNAGSSRRYPYEIYRDSPDSLFEVYNIVYTLLFK